jgi:predicted metal-dependent HD superfamily phosphohydrolase
VRTVHAVHVTTGSRPNAVGCEAGNPHTRPRSGPSGDNGRMAGPPTHPAHDDLRTRWRTALVAARGGAAEPDPAPYGERLLACWAEPHRRYHTTDHLVAVLDHIDVLEPHAADPAVVRLAAWFHDAVYRPDRSENEERSAALAIRALPEAGLPPGPTAEVARLVRLTVTHDPRPADVNGEVLCDADLAVLAGPPGEYAGYAAAVRAEYGFVPDDAFRAGRAAVLRELLALPALFRTPHGARHWEAAARHNLATELELLGA